MDKFIPWLKIEHWYHAVTLLGGVGIFLSLIYDIKGISNNHALLLSLGVFFFGIGEWINHPLQTKIVPPNVYIAGGGIITGHPRNPSLLGSLFDILGFIIIAMAVYNNCQYILNT